MAFLDELIAKKALTALCDYTVLPLIIAQARRRESPFTTVSLTLQSPGGVLAGAAFPPDSTAPLQAGNLLHLMPLNAAECGNRILLDFQKHEWNLAYAFAAGPIPLYAWLRLPAPDSDDRALRFELQALLDGFTMTCRDIIYSFVNNLVVAQPSDETSDLLDLEKDALEAACRFSSAITSCALTDNDGFIVHATGDTELAERIAGDLLAYYRRSADLQATVGTAPLATCMLCAPGQTMFIGQTTIADLQLLLCAQGPFAQALAGFVHTLIVYTLQIRTSRTHGLVTTLHPAPDTTEAAGHHFFSLSGSTVFHAHHCRMLESSQRTALRGFDRRIDAISAGLQPCTVCNP